MVLSYKGCDEMYRVLEAKIAYRGISKKKLADEIQMNYNTLLSKMAGKSKFTLDEAVSIQKYLQEEVSVEELFDDG